MRPETAVVIEDLDSTLTGFDGLDPRLPLEQRKPSRSSARTGMTTGALHEDPEDQERVARFHDCPQVVALVWGGDYPMRRDGTGS